MAILLSLALSYGLHAYFDLFDLQTLAMSSYQNLSKEQVSDDDYRQALALHDACFNEHKRKNLYYYLLHTRYPDPDEITRKQVKKQVDAYMIEAQADKAEHFRETDHVTLARKGRRVVALYNCVEEWPLTNGSIMIYNVCVDPRYRGRGYGQALTEHAIAHCRKDGRELSLTVYKDTPEAQRLYEKLNFKVSEPIHDWGDDFNSYNKYLMRYLPPATKN